MTIYTPVFKSENFNVYTSFTFICCSPSSPELQISTELLFYYTTELNRSQNHKERTSNTKIFFCLLPVTFPQINICRPYPLKDADAWKISSYNLQCYEQEWKIHTGHDLFWSSPTEVKGIMLVRVFQWNVSPDTLKVKLLFYKVLVLIYLANLFFLKWLVLHYSMYSPGVQKFFLLGPKGSIHVQKSKQHWGLNLSLK